MHSSNLKTSSMKCFSNPMRIKYWMKRWKTTFSTGIDRYSQDCMIQRRTYENPRWRNNPQRTPYQFLKYSTRAAKNYLFWTQETSWRDISPFLPLARSSERTNTTMRSCFDQCLRRRFRSSRLLYNDDEFFHYWVNQSTSPYYRTPRRSLTWEFISGDHWPAQASRVVGNSSRDRWL